MLDSGIIKKIESFVYSKPRSMQEIAGHVNKNWRTVDRYVSEIEKEFGTIATRVFRGGTRGALKIAYWASVEKLNSSAFQEELEKQIFQGKRLGDFSAFDIFQHVEERKKEVEIAVGDNETASGLKGLQNILGAAKKQMLVFSGNLSFMNFKNEKINILKEIEKAIGKDISVKVVTRVEVGSKENIEKLLSFNAKYGKTLVEIRHSRQPLRAIIVDKSFFNIKETKLPTGREEELSENIFLFYTIRDKDWVEWLTKIFWKMFSSSISAERRLNEINKLKL